MMTPTTMAVPTTMSIMTSPKTVLKQMGAGPLLLVFLIAAVSLFNTVEAFATIPSSRTTTTTASTTISHATTFRSPWSTPTVQISLSSLYSSSSIGGSDSEESSSPETELSDDFTKANEAASDQAAAASYSLNPSDGVNLLQNLNKDEKSVLSAGALILLDIAFRRLFQKLQIAFPSSLGGMGCLLATLLFTGDFGRKVYDVLQPGAALLAKWLPVFFVPSLVTLPLVGSVGSGAEIAKVMAVIVGGFYFTLLTTAGSVVGVENMSKTTMLVNGATTTSKIDKSEPIDIVTPNLQPPPPTPKLFSDELMKLLRITAIFTGLFALEGASPAFTSAPARFLTKFQVPFLSLHLGAVTLASFAWGARLPKKFTKVVHPLVVCTSLTWAVMKLFSRCVEGGSFAAMLKAYKMGNGWNGLFGTGAGDILLFMLGPAVVSLAISMYEKRQLIKDNAKEVAAGVAVSSIGGLFGTALMVRLAQIAQPSLRIALLSRNITSPLAMAIAAILGASSSTISLAVSMVVVTGLIGANFGASILSSFGIKNPVARGMGIGAAAHGLGTAAFVNEKDAFPFAAISMALTATGCTVLVSIPFIKKLVLQIALGG